VGYARHGQEEARNDIAAAEHSGLGEGKVPDARTMDGDRAGAPLNHHDHVRPVCGHARALSAVC
jgi:hypothetical protein